eukprot:GHVU01188337.1.p1 GENE.GHVU01188337.1~~GHVU01188337.1.p1  ORF type:complete len:134 (+),score=15.75 GHVU01188337.1:1446-1847(+)
MTRAEGLRVGDHYSVEALPGSEDIPAKYQAAVKLRTQKRCGLGTVSRELCAWELVKLAKTMTASPRPGKNTARPGFMARRADASDKYRRSTAADETSFVLTQAMKSVNTLVSRVRSSPAGGIGKVEGKMGRRD